MKSNIDEKDLRIDIYTNSSKKIVMKIMHIHSGICVEDSGESKYKLKKKLIREIDQKLTNNHFRDIKKKVVL